jgi:hypothetical protein
VLACSRTSQQRASVPSGHLRLISHREIDKMLNRIHKLTKHDFNGNREPAAAHTRLASVSEKTVGAPRVHSVRNPRICHEAQRKWAES